MTLHQFFGYAAFASLTAVLVLVLVTVFVLAIQFLLKGDWMPAVLILVALTFAALLLGFELTK